MYSIQTYFKHKTIFSDDGIKDTPVPIPNTEVKLYSADGTWRAASWESRTSLILFSKIAQLVEQSAVNR